MNRDERCFILWATMLAMGFNGPVGTPAFYAALEKATVVYDFIRIVEDMRVFQALFRITCGRLPEYGTFEHLTQFVSGEGVRRDLNAGR